MEQCLEAVELVQLIALNVRDIHNLLYLALVCTRTAGPALEELWKRNHNLINLLSCLPISGDKLIVLDSIPTDYDWNKFTARARLMTELNFHFSTKFDYNIGMFKDRVVIHNDVYDAIVDASLTRLTNDHLFHRLQKLSFHGKSPMSLTEIDSGMLYLVNSKNFGAPSELALYNINIHPKQLIRFSHFDSITTLEISAMQAIKLPSENSLCFRNLRRVTLSLVLFEGDCQRRFFKALGQAKLEYVDIGGMEYAPSMRKLQKILNALCDHCDHDTLRILIMRISPDEEGDFDWVDEIQSIEVGDLEPLACFSQLQALRISEATEVHEDDVKPIASFLARSFPDLEECGIVPLRTHTPHSETNYEDLNSIPGKDWQAVWKELERIKGRTIFTGDVCSHLL